MLGEATVSEAEGHAYQRTYLDLLDGLAAEAAAWPASPSSTTAPGDRCRASTSASRSRRCTRRSTPSTSTAASPPSRTGCGRSSARRIETGAALTLDLEQFRYRDLTLEVFTSLLDEEEFRDYHDAGVVLQAYLRDADQDLERLVAWARDRGRAFHLRLVKGAYWDYETVIAAQEGWPVPVFTHKPDTDAMYEKLTRVDARAPAARAPRVRQPQRALAGRRHRDRARARPGAERLRDPDAARHGRPDQGRRPRHGPAAARVRPGRRAHPGHGVPRAPAAREHGQRLVPAPDVRGGGGGRRAHPAARDVAGLRRGAAAAAPWSSPPTRRPGPVPQPAARRLLARARTATPTTRRCGRARPARRALPAAHRRTRHRDGAARSTR